MYQRLTHLSRAQIPQNESIFGRSIHGSILFTEQFSKILHYWTNHYSGTKRPVYENGHLKEMVLTHNKHKKNCRALIVQPLSALNSGQKITNFSKKKIQVQSQTEFEFQTVLCIMILAFEKDTFRKPQ